MQDFSLNETEIHLHGVQGAAGSNPAIPTNNDAVPKCLAFLLLLLP